MRNDIINKKDEIIRMVNDNESKSSICKMLKCKPITLDNYLKKFGINYKGNRGLKGKKSDNKRKTALEYLKNNNIEIPRLRRKLIEDGIKVAQCEICGLNHWLNQKIPLELHHIDGNRYNNELDNLQILCPNCHSLTPNHSGKLQKIEKQRKKNENFCECGSEIRKKSRQCINCYHAYLKTNIPDKDILLNEVKNHGYSATGRKYGVSDNTIRKWVK